jgi:RNA recognition motif-containing protein
VKELCLASTLGIDSKTVLAYDLPSSIEPEDMEYAFEGFRPTRISRVRGKELNTVSYVLSFSSQADAEKSIFFLNGSSFCGRFIRMHQYD